MDSTSIMFSLAPSEWEENFQDLSGWCLPTTNMIKQQCIADPVEMNVPVSELGYEELQLNINVSKAETNSVQNMDEVIGVEPSLVVPSFLDVWLPTNNSPFIDVEGVESSGSNDSENKDRIEENVKILVAPNGAVSLANWECISPKSNASVSDTKRKIKASRRRMEVSTPKPKLKLNISSNSLDNGDELSTPNIVKMLVESPVLNIKKSSITPPLDLDSSDGSDDILQPFVELGGGFDLLEYMFEDMSKADIQNMVMKSSDNVTVGEEHANVNKLYVNPTPVQKPSEKSKSFICKATDKQKPCSSKQAGSDCKDEPLHNPLPINKQTRREESSSNKYETCYSEKQSNKQKLKKKRAAEALKVPVPSKRSRRSTSSSSNLSDCPLDVRYRELRDRNNEASKRSRFNRKIRDGEMTREALRLEKENHSLKIKAEEMERLVKQLRESLLKTIANKHN